MSSLGDIFNLPTVDNFYFNGLDSGWVSDRFEAEFSRFPYLGSRERLAQMQKEKSAIRKLFESLFKRVKITSIVSLITEHFIGWKLPKGSEPNKLAEDVIKIFDDAESKRTIEQFLSAIQERSVKNRRFFDAVGAEIPSRKKRLSSAKQSTLQDEIVVLTGQLVHRNAIAQYDGKLAQTVTNLPGDWLISDYPPPGMVKENSSFDGRLICLSTDGELEAVFQKYLPFRTDIGWYPYVRATGFFREPGYGESVPSLSLIMCEFRRPNPYAADGRQVFEFLQGELKNRIYLRDKSDLLLAGYILPILAIGSNINQFIADTAEKGVLEGYMQLAGSEIPCAIETWYKKALS